MVRPRAATDGSYAVHEIFFYLYSVQRMLVRVGHSDPDKYPFKHLFPAPDADPSTITPIVTSIADLAGQEHKYCDADQLDADGNFRIPRALRAARAAGYTSAFEKYAAETKAAQEAVKAEQARKDAEIVALKAQLEALSAQCEVRFEKTGQLLKQVL